MSFFYDLNKRLADLANKQEQQQIAESKKAEVIAQSPLTQALNESAIAERSTGDYSAKKARAGKDIGKPGKAFAKIAKSAGERYGSKAAGERVAGAVLNKLRHPKEGIENEGNAFTGALAKTPKGGKFKVGNKEFTDTSSIEEADMVGLEGEMTPKQKAFAKLAPPKDKITFADKIAGAKKEVDEMLGDVAAEAMRKAVMGNHEEEMDEGYAEMDAWLKQREKEKGTGKFDKRERTLPGGMKATTYTRRHDDDVEDDEEVSDAPKKKGRPAGSRRAIGAKGPGLKSKLLKKAAIAEEGDEHVCEMCGQPIAEKAKSKAQQKFMGMVHAAQKGEKPASKEVAKVAKEMPKKAAKDFASTKHKGLPAHVEEESTEKEDQKAEKAGKKVAKDIEHDEGHKAKGDNKAEKAGKKVTKDIEYDDKKDKEEKVDETTTSGSVATAPAAPKSSKGMQFGKGVYESLDTKYKQALTESISIQENLEECGMEGGEPGITIQASGEDAMKLMQLLKLAGLGESETCPGCGHSPCTCEEELDENHPDWPTNDETLDADPNLRTYSGGANGPKSTGQTTTPVIASQLRRQVSMEEGVELERSLFNTWKNYKG